LESLRGYLDIPEGITFTEFVSADDQLEIPAPFTDAGIVAAVAGVSQDDVDESSEEEAIAEEEVSAISTTTAIKVLKDLRKYFDVRKYDEKVEDHLFGLEEALWKCLISGLKQSVLTDFLPRNERTSYVCM